MKNPQEPFVKLFKTPNSYYFYDANKSEFVHVGEASFIYLDNVLYGRGKSGLQMPKELVDLREQGYLMPESVVREVKHGCLDHLEFLLDRKLSNVTLQLTQECNFRCKYCIYSEDTSVNQRSHSSKSMSWETAQKALDFLLEHSVESDRINIGFYGGEPLLEFTMIQRVVAYCEEIFCGKKLTYSMTTNGTLLNQEMITFFEQHDFNLVISLDGPREINDLNRVFINGTGTFNTVMERIGLLNEIAPNYAKKLTISMVIDPKNDFDCINSISLEGSKAKRLSIMPSIVDHGYDQQSALYSEEYILKTNYQRFLAALSFYGRYPEDKISPIIGRAFWESYDDIPKIENNGPLEALDAPSGPCVPGKKRLFVNVSGAFLPCERVSEMSPSCCIGNVYEGFNYKNAYEILNIGALTKDECMKCWCFRFCTACIKIADLGEAGISRDFKLSHCEKIQNNAYAKLRNYLLHKEVPLFYPKKMHISS